MLFVGLVLLYDSNNPTCVKDLDLVCTGHWYISVMLVILQTTNILLFSFRRAFLSTSLGDSDAKDHYWNAPWTICHSRGTANKGWILLRRLRETKKSNLKTHMQRWSGFVVSVVWTFRSFAYIHCHIHCSLTNIIIFIFHPSKSILSMPYSPLYVLLLWI